MESLTGLVAQLQRQLTEARPLAARYRSAQDRLAAKVANQKEALGRLETAQGVLRRAEAAHAAAQEELAKAQQEEESLRRLLAPAEAAAPVDEVDMGAAVPPPAGHSGSGAAVPEGSGVPPADPSQPPPGWEAALRWAAAQGLCSFRGPAQPRQPAPNTADAGDGGESAGGRRAGRSRSRSRGDGPGVGGA